MIDDSRWGQTRYRYNANDQILHTLFEGNRPHEEQFSYDANGNLSQHLPVDAYGAMEQITQHQKAGRVVQQGDIRYRYDDNGRLVEKTEQRDGFRPQIWRYRWDAQNQLTHCETPDGSRWHYRYDAFGRRIRKLKIHDGKLTAANLQLWLAGKPDLTPRATEIYGQDYLWSGDQLIEETPVYADGSLALDCRVRWLYEPGALTPSARYEKGKLHYVVSDHQGTPREMLNENGTLVWAQRLRTWGKADKSQVIASNDADYHVNCNLRFAGQYEDTESGLYYNRFRYYSPETAQYISADPIGLLGGFNPYGYVSNPTNFIDPFGLETCPVLKQRVLDNIATSQVSRESSNFPKSPRSAEEAADRALAAGKMSGASAELRIGNRVFTGVSGDIVPHNPKVTGVLMGTPSAHRAPWHGGCAEISCLDQAFNAGVKVKDLTNATSKALNIGVSGVAHKSPKPACSSCSYVLKYFGVKFE
ncbi:RHS family protein [Xenorhabdus szentirmaii]|nr:RHS family protein [Xenorhabdus szentirmaii]